MGYEHVFIAPHLDDAVLSCGGLIASLRRRGERVLVATLCTASPAADTVFSDLAESLHASWGLAGDQVVARRLEEDRAAMTRLGADFVWAGMLDAIYRAPEDYGTLATLYGRERDGDSLTAVVRDLVAALRGEHAEATFYVPLAIGSHVDHRIACVEGRRIGAVFYEDLPYGLDPQATATRLSEIGPEIEAEFGPGARLEPRLFAFDESTLSQKLDAVADYASQLGELFGGLGGGAPDGEASDAEIMMREKMRAHAIAIGGGVPAERSFVVRR